MKRTKLMTCVLCVAALAAFVLVGCEKLDVYSIDSPSDLQARIDSIAAEKAKQNTGDTTYLNIATAIVGAEDYSSGWNSAFSDYFTVPANKLLHLEFINHNGGSGNNWNNWNLGISNVPDVDADDEEVNFVLRSDAYGWGNDDFDLGLISHNFPDTDGDGDVWNDFRLTMDGALVTLVIDHSVTGNVFVTATVVGTNGTEMEMTYQQPVSATEDIVAFLITDASFFEMEKAYLLPSQVQAVEDVDPVSIVIEGTAPIIEIGDTNFWGNATATVTFADGSSAQVDSADLTFAVVPDMTTLGEKTVSVAYSKTKQGAYTQAITTIFTFAVVNPVTSMEITTLPEITDYYFYDDTLDLIFDYTGLEVTATYSDGSTGILNNASLQFGTIPAVEGAQIAAVTYVGASNSVTVNCPVTLVKGTSQVGASDFSTGWWSQFTPDVTVASGTSTTIKMYVYSPETNPYNSPSTILRTADLATEYGVVRMDNFGWGTGYEGIATATNDWNWEIFNSSLNGSYVEITVTNNGDGTANVHYDVTYNSGETHFQDYAGISVNSADLNCAIVVDGSYIVIVE